MLQTATVSTLPLTFATIWIILINFKILAILYNGARARATGAAKKQSGSSALHAVDTE
jgi:hypothetical protein